MAIADLQQELKSLLAVSPTFQEMQPQARQEMIASLMKASEEEMQETIGILREEAAAPQPDFAGMMLDLKEAEKDLRRAFLEDKERVTSAEESPEALLDRLDEGDSQSKDQKQKKKFLGLF